MSRTKLSIIIVNYNSSAELEQCLGSLKNFMKKEYEVIIVNNSPEDDGLLNIAEEFNSSENFKIYFISSGENRGYGGGNNLGVEHSRGELILFLNPDTRIEKDIFEKIFLIFDSNSKIGIVGPKILLSNGKQEISIGSYPNIGNEILNIFRLDRLPAKLKLKYKFAQHSINEVQWITGSAFFIRSRLFNELRGFDQHYFMYNEDTDLCLRARKRGYRVIYAPIESIMHSGSISSRKDYYTFTKNSYNSKLIFIKKHFSGLYLSIIKFIVILQLLIQLLLWIVIYPMNKSKAYGKLKAIPELLFAYMKKN